MRISTQISPSCSNIAISHKNSTCWWDPISSVIYCIDGLSKIMNVDVQNVLLFQLQSTRNEIHLLRYIDVSIILSYVEWSMRMYKKLIRYNFGWWTNEIYNIISLVQLSRKIFIMCIIFQNRINLKNIKYCICCQTLWAHQMAIHHCLSNSRDSGNLTKSFQFDVLGHHVLN